MTVSNGVNLRDPEHVHGAREARICYIFCFMPKDMGYINSNNGANSGMYPEVKKQCKQQ